MNRISLIIMMYQCINWIRILLEILVTLSIAITACSVLHNLCNVIACTSRFESDISFSASLRIQIDSWLPGRLGKTQFEIFSADFIVDTRGGRRENPPFQPFSTLDLTFLDDFWSTCSAHGDQIHGLSLELSNSDANLVQTGCSLHFILCNNVLTNIYCVSENLFAFINWLSDFNRYIPWSGFINYRISFARCVAFWVQHEPGVERPKGWAEGRNMPFLLCIYRQNSQFLNRYC